MMCLQSMSRSSWSGQEHAHEPSRVTSTVYVVPAALCDGTFQRPLSGASLVVAAMCSALACLVHVPALVGVPTSSIPGGTALPWSGRDIFVGIYRKDVTVRYGKGTDGAMGMAVRALPARMATSDPGRPGAAGLPQVQVALLEPTPASRGRERSHLDEQRQSSILPESSVTIRNAIRSGGTPRYLSVDAMRRSPTSGGKTSLR